MLGSDLGGELERVDLVALLAERVIHAAQVVAHHAQLIFIAPLGGAELILKHSRACQINTTPHTESGERCRTCKRVMF